MSTAHSRAASLVHLVAEPACLRSPSSPFPNLQPPLENGISDLLPPRPAQSPEARVLLRGIPISNTHLYVLAKRAGSLSHSRRQRWPLVFLPRGGELLILQDRSGGLDRQHRLKQMPRGHGGNDLLFIRLAEKAGIRSWVRCSTGHPWQKGVCRRTPAGPVMGLGWSTSLPPTPNL